VVIGTTFGQKVGGIVSEVLPSVPCVGTLAAAGATKVARRRRKRGSEQEILESTDLNALRHLSQASIAKQLGVSASGLCKYLKKHPLEYEVEGVEGEGAEGDGGEKPWSSLENEFLRKMLTRGPRASSDVNAPPPDGASLGSMPEASSSRSRYTTVTLPL